MGYARPPGKSSISTFDLSRVYEAVTIRSSACWPADGERLALAVGIMPAATAIPLANQVAGGLAVLLAALQGQLRRS